MPTECRADLFGFAPVAGRAVVASFDGGAMTSDAGALRLGATNKVLGLTRRLAACFKDSRDPAYTEHQVETLVMQRVTGIALGYEDLNDYDQLRHDLVLAARTGKPARRFKDFRWSTLDSWSRRRRVIGRAEWTRGEANPRFMVTLLTPAEIDARRLYDVIYCARGELDLPRFHGQPRRTGGVGRGHPDRTGPAGQEVLDPLPRVVSEGISAHGSA
ncbi:MAG: transposase, partial [Acetobacteraceae bacterium]